MDRGFETDHPIGCCSAVSHHANGNARTAEFIALAEELSGQDLGPFFDTWLYAPEKPAEVPASGARPFGTDGTSKLLTPHRPSR